MNNNSIYFQSCWRAYIVRRSITNKKVLEARKRIKAADSDEANKLKNRTSRSLELLFKDSRVSNMMVALEELGKICIILLLIIYFFVKSLSFKFYIQYPFSFHKCGVIPLFFT